MAPPTRQQLRAAWGAVARTSLAPAAGAPARAAWAGPVVVATGALVAATAWLGARAVLAAGVVPAIAAIVAVLVALVAGAAIIERDVVGAVERWFGARWSAAIVGGTVVARVVVLWTIAPARWLGALVLAGVIGRWAAIALQRLGDVVIADRGLAVGDVTWLELGVTTAATFVLAAVVCGWAGVALVVVLGLLAFGLGLVVQAVDGELTAANLAAAAVALELVALVALSVIAPAAASPFVR
ncbi:MAG TPA: hypothetical protein VHE35_08965 [Kofleriaceae bacterium]|nr:hypothetical protein [Kofleriaceae bacterium]